MSWLSETFAGWKEIRHVAGYSYQVARSGKRRIIRDPDFHHEGEPDEHWRLTGQWSEEQVGGHFHELINQTRKAAS